MIFIIDEGTANLDSKLADDIEEIILKRQRIYSYYDNS